MFIPDSYRGDVLGHRGNPGAVTPCLDRLVLSDAVSFSNTFAQNPVCTPSRCSFITGLYPHVQGHRSMRNMLKEHEPNLLSVLKREGYGVWWGGKNDLVRVREKDDYLQYCDVKIDGTTQRDDMPNYVRPPALAGDDPRRGAFYSGVMTRDGEGTVYGDADTTWVLEAIDLIKAHDGMSPFACYLPLRWPHPAYLVEEDFYDAIDPDRIPPRVPTPGPDANLPRVLDAIRAAYKSDEITDEMWRDVKRIYYAMCAKVDALFGKVVDALKEKGLYDDTLILFFSDHGDFAGDYSLPEKTHSTLQDCLLHVPLVVKPPSDVATRSGKREHLTELLDISATIYDLLGIDPGYDTQGESLRASLAGDSGEIHDSVFAEVGSREGEVGFINTDVEKMPPDSFYALQSGAANPFHRAGSHAMSCRTHTHKYVRRTYVEPNELYDLVADPGETRNLSGLSEYAEIEREMETRMLDFLMRTTDVLPHESDSRHV
jgi:arylsulfatase A-like enzyme